MAEFRDIVRRLKSGHGLRDIHRSTGIHRTVVRQLRDLAEQRGWLEAEAPLPTELEIEEARRDVGRTTAPAALSTRLSDHREDFKRWLDEGHSYVVMHELIRSQVPCSLSTVMRYVKREFPQPVDVVMRRETAPGKVMEVDFGYLGITYDPDSGKNRRTWVFSGRLRHSRRAFRERCFDQKQQTFFSCHIHAFEHFGGVVADSGESYQ